MDMTELASLKVFSGVVFGQKDFFFVKRLNPSLSPRLPMKIPHPSEDEVARAKVWYVLSNSSYKFLDSMDKYFKGRPDQGNPTPNNNQILDNFSGVLSQNQNSQSGAQGQIESVFKSSNRPPPQDPYPREIPQKDLESLIGPSSPMLSPTLSESPVSFTGHGLYKLQGLGIKESELGEYLFEYFSNLPQIFLNHYDHSLSSIQKRLYPCLTQQYLRIMNKETRSARGLVIFGLEPTYTSLLITHLSSSDKNDYPSLLSDTLFSLQKDFPQVSTLKLLLRYSSTPKTAYHIDPGLRSAVAQLGFSLQSIGHEGGERVGCFVRHKESTDRGARVFDFGKKGQGRGEVAGVGLECALEVVLVSIGGGLMPPKGSRFHQPPNNFKWTTESLLKPINEEADEPYVDEHKQKFKEIVDWLNETQRDIDLRATLTAALAHYTTMCSRWNKTDFEVGGYDISRNNFAKPREGIVKLPVR